MPDYEQDCEMCGNAALVKIGDLGIEHIAVRCQACGWLAARPKPDHYDDWITLDDDIEE